MGDFGMSIAVVAGVIWLCTRGVSGFTNFVESETRKAKGESGVRWMYDDDEDEDEDEDDDVPVNVNGNRARTYRATVRRRL